MYSKQKRSTSQSQIRDSPESRYSKLNHNRPAIDQPRRNSITTKVRLSDYLQSSGQELSTINANDSNETPEPITNSIINVTAPISFCSLLDPQTLLNTIKQLKQKDAEQRLLISKLQQQNTQLKKDVASRDKQILEHKTTISNDRNYIALLDQQVRRLKSNNTHGSGMKSQQNSSFTNTPNKPRSETIQIQLSSTKQRPSNHSLGNTLPISSVLNNTVCNLKQNMTDEDLKVQHTENNPNIANENLLIATQIRNLLMVRKRSKSKENLR